MDQRVWWVHRASPVTIDSITVIADSNIIHVNAAGTSIVILNSYEAAVELLERRSTLYSSRSSRHLFRLISTLLEQGSLANGKRTDGLGIYFYAYALQSEP